MEKLIPKVDKLFSAIGKTNGTAPAASQDAQNAAQHEYLIATFGESYWKKRREKAKNELLKVMSGEAVERLEARTKEVAKSGNGTNVELIDGDNYSTVVEIKNGASFVDTTQLGIILMREHKFTHEQVAKLMEKATDRRAPACSFKTVEK